LGKIFSTLRLALWFEKEAEKRRQKRAEELIAVKHEQK
jgi:hypothetical protein